MFNFTTAESGNIALLIISVLVLWVVLYIISRNCLTPDDIALYVVLNTIIVLTCTILLQPVYVLIILASMLVCRLGMCCSTYIPWEHKGLQGIYISFEWAAVVVVCLFRHLN